jgi:DNA-directed RNA polymerase specialized sigma24 family protein
MAMTDEQYRGLYTKLHRFFEWNRCALPADLAQDTIVRGLKRLSDGQQDYAHNPYGYYFGIASNILREERKRPRLEAVPVEECAPAGVAPDAVQWRILLRECLSQLAAADRDLIVAYTLEGPEKTAKRFGITPNAVRIRVSRIRSRITQSLHGPVGPSG